MGPESVETLPLVGGGVDHGGGTGQIGEIPVAERIDGVDVYPWTVVVPFATHEILSHFFVEVVGAGRSRPFDGFGVSTTTDGHFRTVGRPAPKTTGEDEPERFDVSLANDVDFSHVERFRESVGRESVEPTRVRGRFVEQDQQQPIDGRRKVGGPSNTPTIVATRGEWWSLLCWLLFVVVVGGGGGGEGESTMFDRICS